MAETEVLEREKEKNIVDGEDEKIMEQRQEKNKNTAAKAKSDRKLFYTIRSQKKDLIKELAQKKNDETHLKKVQATSIPRLFFSLVPRFVHAVREMILHPDRESK